jgi:hypothetical protein
MQFADILRYGLWCGIVATAEANRREYAMKTTWMPHLLTNTASLLLPDLFEVLVDGQNPLPAAGATTDENASGIFLEGRPPQTPPFSEGTTTDENVSGIFLEGRLPQTPPFSEGWHVIRETLAVVVRDNPRYVVYVAPLAAGYLLSHPRFNIYKGELAEIQLAGFTLDAIPHGATAFGLTALVGDMVHVAAGRAPREGRLARWLDWADRNPALFSAAVLALATVIWEVGEYRIYRHELELRGDAGEINMQWGPIDTVYDCIANALGWGMATAWRRLTKLY